MQKISTLFLSFLFICFGINSDVLAQDEGVTDVKLDSTEAFRACPPGHSKSGIYFDEERKIQVFTIAKEAEKKGLTYYYLVSGGKIVGNGAHVVWEFNMERAGTYTITAVVGKNGIIQGNFVTKTIKVVPIDCPIPCECSDLNMLGPTVPARRGDTLLFTAEVKGGTQDRTTYNWTVSSGTIIYGQGTRHILVKTDKDKKVDVITATVEIGGLCMFCPDNASASVELKDK